MSCASGTFLAWQSRDSAGYLPSSTLSRLSKPLLPLLLLDLPANTWAKGLKEGSRNVGEGSGSVDSLEGIFYSDAGAAVTAVGEVERHRQRASDRVRDGETWGWWAREVACGRTEGSEQARGRQRATQTAKRRAAQSKGGREAPARQGDPHSVRVEGRDVLGVQMVACPTHEAWWVYGEGAGCSGAPRWTNPRPASSEAERPAESPSPRGVLKEKPRGGSSVEKAKAA